MLMQVRLAITIIAFACLLVEARAVAETPCFAYLQDGDIYMACGDQTLRLTNRGDVSDFAVADDGSAVAVKYEYVVGRTKDSAGRLGDCDVLIYSLSSNAPPRTIRHSCSGLYATCGTVLLQGSTEEAEDVLARKQLRISGYRRFVCSRDRSVVAGWPRDGSHDFSVGEMSMRVVAPVAGGASVSPSGIVSYFTEGSNDNSLCELRPADKQICLKNADAFGAISVSDSGETLFTTHTDGGCFYRKHRVVKAHPPATGDDQCLGIAMWKPGADKVLVKELAEHPQWLTHGAVETLKSCAAKGKDCFGKG
jgi:hypothetical protein